MEPFLKVVAHKMWEIYGNEIENISFVFPNRRSGLFFQKYLSQIIDRTIFSPQITTIYNFIEDLSDFRIAERLKLLFCLYDNYIKISNNTQSFDDFFKWGDILLNDFDDIDKSMGDAKQILTNLSDLKEIEDDLSYLEAAQVDIIKRFWKNFKSEEDKTENRTFKTIWKILYELYINYTRDLKSKKIGYSGIILRDIADRIKDLDSSKLPNKIIFIGLNALSIAEERILLALKEKKIADFYWDYDSPLLSNDENKATYFVKRNKSNFPSRYTLDYGFQTQNDIKPKLNIIGISSNVGQAKYVSSILDNLSKDEILDISKMNTAIVLPNENLLIPTLYSIPKEIENINITMGYKLNKTTIANLLNIIFAIQLKSFKNSQNEKTFYHKDVINILKNKLIYSITKTDSDTIISDIKKNNLFYIKPSIFESIDFLKDIFVFQTNWEDFSSYIKNIISRLYNNLISSSNYNEDILNNQNIKKNIFDIECDFIIECYKVINQLTSSLKELGANVEIITFVSLLRKAISTISIPFEGEPLGGLQIMGVLETRALDFENLIILSVNENIFPSKKKNNTFIPYSLKKGFNLQTKEHHDSVFAYNFYRLISRARNIYLVYDSRTEGALSGEVSRYYSQIKHLYYNHFEIIEHCMTYQVSTSNIKTPIIINKTQNVMEKLEEFKMGGTRKLSASSLNSYINCPLQFYLQQIERLREEEEMEEKIESHTIGTIYHYLMEKIYEKYIGRTVTKDIITDIRNNTKYIESLVKQAFEKEKLKITGYNKVIFEVLKKYIDETLNHDAKVGPFKYIASEYKLDLGIKCLYTTSNDLKIQFTGSIDRIDELNNKLRIIDYKTGSDELIFVSIEDLFDRNKEKRPKAIMQTFLYALLYTQKNNLNDISPNIYLISAFFDKRSKDKIINTEIKTKEKEGYIPIIFNKIREDFTRELDKCLEELFNPDIDFYQTENLSNCKYCFFKEFCKR